MLLTGWLGLIGGVIFLLVSFFLSAYFGDEVPFIYLNVLFVFTLLFPITSGIFMIRPS